MTAPSPAPISASEDSQASAANGEALPGWPAALAGTSDTLSALVKLASYNRALAAAWEARARLLADALRDCAKAGYVAAEYMSNPMQSHQEQMSNALWKAGSALAAIGPLPSPKEQRT